MFVESLGQIQIDGISKAPWWGLPGPNSQRHCLVQVVPTYAPVV